MSENSEILNLSALCRCCHTDGEFRSLQIPYVTQSSEEIYSDMLESTFGIKIYPPLIKASYTICNICIQRLQDASQFKRQVLICEQKFEEYCKNEQAQELVLGNIKVEFDLSDNDNDNCNDNKNNIQSFINEGCKTEIEDADVKSTGHTANDSVETCVEKVKVEIDINTCATHHERRTTPKPTKCWKSKPTNQTKKLPDEYNPSLEIKIKTENGLIHSCRACKTNFRNKKKLQQHILQNHTDRFACEICSKKYSNKMMYNKHMRTHTERQMHKCTKCYRTFKNKSSRDQHVTTHNAERFSCDICQKEFKCRSTLIVHIKKHLGVNKVALCDICGWKFNDNSNLNVHIKAVHEKLRIFTCSVCQKTFSTKKSLKHHSTCHAPDSMQTCDVCSKPFSCMYSLKAHKLRHDKKYLCKMCKNIFDDKREYLCHLRKHRQDRPGLMRKCPQCPKEFYTKYCLNRHMDTHDNLKKFVCEVCFDRFTQKSGLLRHTTRKHGSGKTTCSLCNKLVCDINKHNRRTHGAKDFKCGVCDKCFGDKETLTRHNKDVHVDAHFSCYLCEKMYKYKRGLWRHMCAAHHLKKDNENYDTVLAKHVIKNESNAE